MRNVLLGGARFTPVSAISCERSREHCEAIRRTLVLGGRWRRIAIQTTAVAYLTQDDLKPTATCNSP